MPPTLALAPQTTAANPLRTRIVLAALILSVECLALAYIPHPWLRLQQPAASPIVFFAALLFFGRDRLRAAQLAAEPVKRRFAALHLLSLALTIAASLCLSRSAATNPWATGAAIAFWAISLFLAAVSLLCSLFVPRKFAKALSSLGIAWIFAALCAALAMSARTLLQLAWNAPESRFGQALTSATFRGVQTILNLFYRGVVADRAHNILGTGDFVVEVRGVCSGMEGLSLILVLTVGWLVYARHELRLTRAVWLVPISLCLMWLLNLVRISALIAIGASGHPLLAVTGFHAEAGWILFNLVALSFLVAAQRVTWLRKPMLAEGSAGLSSAGPHTNQAAVYLLPFLVIIAASLLTQAASSGFEWLYPLRFVAAAAALWAFRSSYRQMDWRFTWLGPASGVLVFGLWLTVARASLGASTPLFISLTALPGWQRNVWLTVRVLAAVITVPIAEELAFRGYLARRIMNPDVDAVPMGALNLAAILLSSAAFGLMHGGMAVAGFAAGLIFALVARRTDRLGDAVAAHATTNLLLAAWVLTRGDYALW